VDLAEESKNFKAEKLSAKKSMEGTTMEGGML